MISTNQDLDVLNSPVRRNRMIHKGGVITILYIDVRCFDGGRTTSDLSERDVSDGKLKKGLRRKEVRKEVEHSRLKL